MNIAFLTSGHYPDDDRIFYHLAVTLADHGHNVLVISSKAEIKKNDGRISTDSFDGKNISKRNKISAFIYRLEAFNPDISICSEPLPIIASKKYRSKTGKKLKIIYDITEWYPAGRFLMEYPPIVRWFGFMKLFTINAYASLLVNAFIFGEWHKSRPYRFLFPFTPYRIITYYTDLKYIAFKEPYFKDRKLRLSYSGEISIEKGFGNFIKVVNSLSDRFKDLSIEVKLPAWYNSETERRKCESLIPQNKSNVTFSFRGKQKFIEFSREINETDIFLDLREINCETNNSLPIKLFHYAALGRPVIISDLKAVRREVEIEKFGFPVKPYDAERITEIISDYLKNQDLYMEHCINARRLSEEKYNWLKVASEFLDFIESV